MSAADPPIHCGCCGSLLNGGTDEPVAARELRAERDEAIAEVAAMRAQLADIAKTVEAVREHRLGRVQLAKPLAQLREMRGP